MTTRDFDEMRPHDTHAALRKSDLAHAENHLAIAQSNASEAKQEIALVGQLKADGG